MKTMTAKTLQANRRNAARSTGPKSPAGKAAVSLNRLTHGLAGAALVIPGESAQEYERLKAATLDQLAPVGALERALAERAAGCLWRLQRLERVEAGLFTSLHVSVMQGRDECQQRRRHVQQNEDQADDLMAAYGTPAFHYEPDLELEAAQEGPLPTLGEAYTRDCMGAGAFDKLARYGAATERSLFRSLHELERLQRRRQGEEILPPAALDVTVNNGFES